MATVRAEEVRIPRHAREALARHEEVVVTNRDRPVYLIANPEDRPQLRRGRRLREALAILADTPSPDEDFAQDMEQVIASVGPSPRDPWAPS